MLERAAGRDLLSVPPLDGESGVDTRRKFPPERRLVFRTARQQQTRTRSEVGFQPQSPHQGAYVPDGVATRAIARDRVAFADFSDEAVQGHIDLVLEEAGSAGRAAVRHIAPIQRGHAQARLRQVQRGQGTGYARTDHRDIAGVVFFSGG